MGTKNMSRTNNSTEETKVIEKKIIKYNEDDLIMCKSLVTGGLYIKGKRSDFLYMWADYGDEVGIEYRDLIYMLRSNDKNVYLPRILILDENIVDQYPKIKTIYDSLYTVGTFSEIIKLPSYDMKIQIEKLPNSVKSSFKNYIATLIDNGSLDSVSTIKTIDEIFGTKYLLTMAEY